MEIKNSYANTVISHEVAYSSRWLPMHDKVYDGRWINEIMSPIGDLNFLLD